MPALEIAAIIGASIVAIPVVMVLASWTIIVGFALFALRISVISAAIAAVVHYEVLNNVAGHTFWNVFAAAALVLIVAQWPTRYFWTKSTERAHDDYRRRLNAYQSRLVNAGVPVPVTPVILRRTN